MNKTNFEGVKVKLAGKQYVVPHLNFKARRTPEIESLIRDFFKEQIAVMEAKEKGDDELTNAVIDLPFVGRYLPILHAALTRNYPELTIEELDENLELGDVPDFMTAIIAALNAGKVSSRMGEALAAAS